MSGFFHRFTFAFLDFSCHILLLFQRNYFSCTFFRSEVYSVTHILYIYIFYWNLLPSYDGTIFSFFTFKMFYELVFKLFTLLVLSKVLFLFFPPFILKDVSRRVIKLIRLLLTTRSICKIYIFHNFYQYINYHPKYIPNIIHNFYYIVGHISEYSCWYAVLMRLGGTRSWP